MSRGISATSCCVRVLIVFWATCLWLLREQMLQLVIASHNEGTKSKSGSKHLLVFCLFFQSMGRILLGNLPVVATSWCRSCVSPQLFKHNWKTVWPAERKGWAEAQKQSAAVLQNRAEQNSTAWTTSRINNRRLWLTAVAHGKHGYCEQPVPNMRTLLVCIARGKLSIPQKKKKAIESTTPLSAFKWWTMGE